MNRLPMKTSLMKPIVAGITRTVVSALVIFSAATMPMAAQEMLFERGNQQYQNGDYEGAAESYLQILDAGYESGTLFYNLGNAYFKQGDLGRSILFYERALRLNPRDDAASANLELAQSLTADEITPLPGFWALRLADWWVHLFPQLWVRWIVGLSYVVGMAAAVLVIAGGSQKVRVWGRRLAILAGTVVMVFGINLVSIEFGIGQPVEAIVLADEVTVQSAPSDDLALQAFTIHEGTKARIDQQSGEWAEIVLADGKVGWVRVAVLEII